MFIIYGVRSAGRIYDGANQLVATVFIHLFFIPLIPIGGLLVKKKGWIVDQGEELPTNKKSVIAAYLRHLFFAGGCLGFAMMYDGLFLGSVIPSQRVHFLTVSTTIFAVSALLWVFTMFWLGARRVEDRFLGDSTIKIFGALLLVAAIPSIMFAVEAIIPDEITIEKVAADQTLSDAEAIERMAAIEFPKDATIETKQSDTGIELSVTYEGMKERTMRTFPGQSKEEIASIRKATIIFPLAMNIEDIIRHGRARNLSKISVKIFTPVEDGDGNQMLIDLYKVFVVKDQFRDFIDSSKGGRNPFSKEGRQTLENIFENCTTLEVDNFNLFEFVPAER